MQVSPPHPQPGLRLSALASPWQLESILRWEHTAPPQRPQPPRPERGPRALPGQQPRTGDMQGLGEGVRGRAGGAARGPRTRIPLSPFLPAASCQTPAIPRVPGTPPPRRHRHPRAPLPPPADPTSAIAEALPLSGPLAPSLPGPPNPLSRCAPHEHAAPALLSPLPAFIPLLSVPVCPGPSGSPLGLSTPPPPSPVPSSPQL